MRQRGWVGAALAVVLLVAGARADAPPGRFTDNGDGTVTDSRTTLVWQQTAWPSTVTWNAAVQNCASNAAGLPGSGWRLATAKELLSIVDRSRTDPAIDDTLFFGTNSNNFWSATCYAGGEVCPAAGSFAWYVHFYDGGGVNRDPVGTSYWVRCVR